MGTVKHAIEENDVVVLQERVGKWPAGTKGTAVSIYDDAALVEVSEDVPPGRALDTFVVPAAQLEGHLAHRRPSAWRRGSLSRRKPGRQTIRRSDANSVITGDTGI